MRRDDGPEAAGRVAFIAGVSTYCDRWCERCRFQSRCRLYRDTVRMEQFMEGQLDTTDLEALQSDAAFEVDERAPQVSARDKEPFLESLADAHEPMFPEESARFDAAFERREREGREHPLSRGAMEYAAIAHRLLGALGPVFRAGGDPLAIETLETIGRHSSMIAVKTRRAVTALLPASDALGDDDQFRQSDGNGCAKLVRLMVAESRDAWRLLAMATRLDDLDRQLGRAFPKAMAFVRPGFDEG